MTKHWVRDRKIKITKGIADFRCRLIKNEYERRETRDEGRETRDERRGTRDEGRETSLGYLLSSIVHRPSSFLKLPSEILLLFHSHHLPLYKNVNYKSNKSYIRTTMKFGDLEGKGSIYSTRGEPNLEEHEQIVTTLDATCGKGWRKYKLGWRPMFYEGQGTYYFTNERLIYLRRPVPHPRVHTLNIQNELGDFGGWAYHAHRANRAFEFGGYEFFEFAYEQIEKVEIEEKNTRAVIFIDDNKNKYKLYVDIDVGEQLRKVGNVKFNGD